MLGDAVENNSETINSLFINFEQQFGQLLLEAKSNKLIIKTTQDNFNECLKRNILLEHELQTERFNKSMIKLELDSLTTTMNKCKGKNNTSSEFDIDVLIHDREYLTNKIYKMQVENFELKQELAKSNGQLSLLMANQHKYPEKMNIVTSMFSTLQTQIKKLEKESHTLVNILKISNILARKILSALEYSKKLNNIQFDHIQHLLKEVANAKGQIHMFINQNVNHQIMNTEQENIITSNQTQLEIYMKLVEILETENHTLHKNVQYMFEKQ